MLGRQGRENKKATCSWSDAAAIMRRGWESLLGRRRAWLELEMRVMRGLARRVPEVFAVGFRGLATFDLSKYPPCSVGITLLKL